MTIVLLVIVVALLIGSLILGIRAVTRRQRIDYADPAAGSAVRDSQAHTSANGWVGRGGGVGSGGN